jgi:CRISPR-associated endonuclease Cas2
MSTHQKAHWIVNYDIVDNYTRGQVFKCLKGHGTPSQYSVFAVDASNAQMGALMAQLAKIIDHHADDVRAYRLPCEGWRATLGNTMLPDDLWLKD